MAQRRALFSKKSFCDIHKNICQRAPQYEAVLSIELLFLHFEPINPNDKVGRYYKGHMNIKNNGPEMIDFIILFVLVTLCPFYFLLRLANLFAPISLSIIIQHFNSNGMV